jgi:hypothetical protein
MIGYYDMIRTNSDIQLVESSNMADIWTIENPISLGISTTKNRPSGMSVLLYPIATDTGIGGVWRRIKVE